MKAFTIVTFVAFIIGTFVWSISSSPDQSKPDNSPTPAEALAERLFEAASKHIVYVTSKGHSYHKKDCPTIARSKHVIETNEGECNAKDLQPCLVCRPNP